MIFTKRKSIDKEMNLKIDNEPITATNVRKFLGVWIDDQLNWKTHIYNISGKISRGIAIIVKARKFINTEGLKCLYHTFIYPYLTYGNHIWGSTYKSKLDKIYVLQKRQYVLYQAHLLDVTQNLYSNI